MRLQYLTDDGIQYLKGNFETNLPHYIQKDSAFFAANCQAKCNTFEK